MTTASTKVPEFTIEAAKASFHRHLRAANRSPRTIQSYLEAVELFDRYVTEQGMPREVRAVHREHVESWIVSLQERYRPASVANRYRSLRVFFNWLVSEEEIDRSPMAKMPAPFTPEQPVPLLSEAEVQALLATCDGTTFDERRDLAILRVLIDTGIRRAECAALRVNDVTFDSERLWVEMGKGRRSRPVTLHAKTIKAIDRYLRLRPRHAHHREDALWLGKRGPLGDGGVLQIVRRRGRQAGLPDLHPHALRHLAAHNDADDGMSVPDMMNKFGWRDPSMALRYGSSAAVERSLAHSRALKGGDRY